MGMKSYKASGSNDFQSIFNKNVLGDDVWKFMKETFETSMFNPLVAETLIMLILKFDVPKHFKDFRPISLFNVIYKLIFKVLLNRMWTFFNALVSLMNSSFIPRRGKLIMLLCCQKSSTPCPSLGRLKVV